MPAYEVIGPKRSLFGSVVAPVLLVVLLLGVSPAQAAECVRGPYLQNATAGSVTVRWELDSPGLSSLRLESTGAKARQIPCRFFGRKHRVELKDLAPGQRYRYSIYFGAKAATESFEFRAPFSGPEKFTFAVFGDSGRGTRDQRRVAEVLAKSDAELTLLTGDIIYGGGEEEHYELRFFEPYADSLTRMAFWPALGNHDVKTKNGAAALAVFDVPANGPKGIQVGRNYSFDYGGAHIAAIDSNVSAEDFEKQLGPWLEKDMAASEQPWKFVFFHHPPYSSGKHGGSRHMQKSLVPSFVRAGIDVAFAGHDHTYERSKPIDGVRYVVSGNGGNRLYPKRFENDWSARFYNEKHGLTLVTIEGDRLLLRHVNVDGEEVDRLEIEKGQKPGEDQAH